MSKTCYYNNFWNEKFSDQTAAEQRRKGQLEWRDHSKQVFVCIFGFIHILYEIIERIWTVCY